MAKQAIDMSEADASRDFASLLARVREGAEVVIKNGSRPVAVVKPGRSAHSAALRIASPGP